MTWEAHMAARARMRKQVAESLEPVCECPDRGRVVVGYFTDAPGAPLDRCGRCGAPLGDEAWRP